jgi:hypothetical protein
MRDHANELVPEVAEDRDDRGEMQQDVEGEVSRELLPAEDGGYPDEVAEEDTGMNSVAPWTMPSTTACKTSTR